MTIHRVPDLIPPEDGDLTSVTVAGRAVAVTVADGQAYAFDDACTHAQCSLASGKLEGRSVLCPCHFRAFDIAHRRVLSGPPKTALRTYPARLVDGTLVLEVTE